ncbi:MAG: saccharopine dehydrogenase NADP-binding domain-containing protein, partial [Alphaproteobacteria bacterium]|nr:saccharopine dehydrogenase NADP-binding domain-containing protein [Alphaproteobacteria bacterium]
MSEGASNKVDVTVLGATGYTGGLVCEFLATQAGAEGRSWAVAGRRKDALDELVKAHGAVSAVTADCTSEADCRKLAGSSRVVLNLAGPYYERAEPLVKACVEAGTHYLDLSGELIFVRDLIDAYHAT